MKKVLICLLLLLPFSCKHEGVSTTPNLAGGGFMLSKTIAQPLEILTIVLDKPSSTPNLDVRLGTTSLSTIKIDDKTYAFQVPEATQPGNYACLIPTINQLVQVTIQQPTPIADPVTYTQAYLKLAATQFEKAKAVQDSLVKYNLITAATRTQEQKAMGQKLDDAIAQFNALTEKDKRACAQFIAANRARIDSLHSQIMTMGTMPSLKNGRVMADCPVSPIDTYTECTALKLKKLNAEMRSELFFLIASLEIGQPVFAAAFGVLFLMDLYTLFEIQSSFVNLLSVYSGEDPEATVEAKSTVKNGDSRIVSYLMPFINIHKDIDKKLVSQSIQEFIASFESIKQLVDTKLGSLIPLKIALPSIRKGKKLPEALEKLSVKILNNPKVSAVLSDFKNGLFRLSFKTDEKSSQQFDYKLSYQYAGKEITKTIESTTLVVTGTQVDLTDCQIKTSDGIPIITPGEAGKAYTFSLEGTCKFPRATLFSWNFGDGTADVVDADINQVKHTYKTAGNYTIKLRVLTQEPGTDYIYFEKAVSIKEPDKPNLLSDYYITFTMNNTVYTADVPLTTEGSLEFSSLGATVQNGVKMSWVSLIGRWYLLNNRFRDLMHIEFFNGVFKGIGTYITGDHLVTEFFTGTQDTYYNAIFKKGPFISPELRINGVWYLGKNGGEVIVSKYEKGKLIEGTFKYMVDEYINNQKTGKSYEVVGVFRIANPS
ncbi:PKD domain-containing protein [Spirosoma panaciterrae]|uniref:PKD domain-containing protein n=1 Tax=Spirosoma panaciterrae TaxID=496058 RepID=UPI0003A586E0|nr:PKD domain-containing protein [Spirosoma panaciterrae]